MISKIVEALRERPEPVPTPNPDRMCAAYRLLARRLFQVLPHEHSRLEMHHMMYVAQVLSIARNDRPLFGNQFTATLEGPVLKTLWKLQNEKRGMESIMHPIHADLLDDEDVDTIHHVADRLARLDPDQISVYSNSSTSACAKVLGAWMKDVGTSGIRRTDGFVGTRAIEMSELEAEVQRRYAKVLAARRRTDAGKDVVSESNVQSTPA